MPFSISHRPPERAVQHGDPPAKTRCRAHVAHVAFGAPQHYTMDCCNGKGSEWITIQKDLHHLQSIATSEYVIALYGQLSVAVSKTSPSGKSQERKSPKCTWLSLTGLWIARRIGLISSLDMRFQSYSVIFCLYRPNSAMSQTNSSLHLTVPFCQLKSI